MLACVCILNLVEKKQATILDKLSSIKQDKTTIKEEEMKTQQEK